MKVKCLSMLEQCENEVKIAVQQATFYHKWAVRSAKYALQCSPKNKGEADFIAEYCRRYDVHFREKALLAFQEWQEVRDRAGQ